MDLAEIWPQFLLNKDHPSSNFGVGLDLLSGFGKVENKEEKEFQKTKQKHKAFSNKYTSLQHKNLA